MTNLFHLFKGSYLFLNAYTVFLHPAPFYFFFFSFFCAHQIVVLSSPFPVTSPKRKASLSSIQAIAAILPSYTDIIIIIIYIYMGSLSQSISISSDALDNHFLVCLDVPPPAVSVLFTSL